MMRERIDTSITLWSKRGALVLLGWFASSGTHETLTARKAIEALPVVEAARKCEDWRANKNAALALGANVVAKWQLPKDCPHPKIDVPPK